MVSIIIPVYNIEPSLLTRCVESVLHQTYGDMEVLLVDDGSTDGSGKLCDELAKKYEESDSGSLDTAASDIKIRVFHKENGGSSSARNLGIREAKGDYIGFVDCDDYIDEDFVESMIGAIKRTGFSMAQISRDEIAEDGHRLPDVCIPPKEEIIISSEDMMRELLMHRGDCSYCTRLTKRELFDGRKFPEDMLNEDFRLLVDMLTDIDRFVILPKQAYHVFYRSESNSRSRDKEQFKRVYMDIVDNADYVEELVDEKYPGLKAEAKRFALYQRMDYMLHIPIHMMNRDNAFYVNTIRYLRKNVVDILANRYLTSQNRLYLMLFSIAPKTVRTVHRKIKK